MLTKAQVEEIVQIVHQHFGFVSWFVTGILPDGLDIKELKAAGILADDVPEDLIQEAYAFGILSAISPTMNFDEIKAQVEVGIKFPMEEVAVKWLKEGSSLYITALGNQFCEKTKKIVHNAEKEEALRKVYQETLSEGAAARKTRGQIVTMLRDATKEVTRDMHRVVNTELHSARTEATADYLTSKKGKDVTVVVRPAPDACPLCKKMYLGKDGKSKAFKLADLEVSNIGRSKEELIAHPGKPPVHPHCACQLMYFNPETQEFNEKGQIVFKDGAFREAK